MATLHSLVPLRRPRTVGLRQTFRLAAPLVGSRWLHMANGFIGMVLIARLGRETVAAGALVASTVSLLQMTLWSLFFAVGVIVARAQGAGEVREAGRIVRQGCVLGLLVGLPFTGVVWNASTLLRWLGQPAALLPLTTQYFHGVAWGILPSLWYVCFSEFVTGIGRARLVLLWTMLTAPCTLLLAYALLFGKGGLPNVGFAGLAYAMAMMYWALFLGPLLYFFFCKDYKKYELFGRAARWRFDYGKKIFLVGWPISVQMGAEIGVFSMVTYLMGWFGVPVLAAQQVVIQCNTLAAMIPYGVSQASGVLVGQAWGGQAWGRARQYGNAAVQLVLVSMVGVACVYLVFPHALIALFLRAQAAENTTAVRLAVVLLAISAVALLFDAVRVTVTGNLRGFHDTRVPMWIGVVVGWVLGLPLGYFFAVRLRLGAPGLPIGLAFASSVGVVALLWRFRWLSRGPRDSGAGGHDQ